jgi:hypothetical protein
MNFIGRAKFDSNHVRLKISFKFYDSFASANHADMNILRLNFQLQPARIMHGVVAICIREISRQPKMAGCRYIGAGTIMAEMFAI